MCLHRKHGLMHADKSTGTYTHLHIYTHLPPATGSGLRGCRVHRAQDSRSDACAAARRPPTWCGVCVGVCGWVWVGGWVWVCLNLRSKIFSEKLGMHACTHEIRSSLYIDLWSLLYKVRIPEFRI